VTVVARAINAFLANKCDDGNKDYIVRQVQVPSQSDEWHDAMSLTEVAITSGIDVFATVDVDIDEFRHVDPV